MIVHILVSHTSVCFIININTNEQKNKHIEKMLVLETSVTESINFVLCLV